MGNNQVFPTVNNISAYHQNIKLGCYCPVCDEEHYITVKLPKIEPWHNLRAASDVSDYIYANVNKCLQTKFTKDCYTKDEIGVGKFELSDFIVLQQFDDYLNIPNQQEIKKAILTDFDGVIDWEINARDFDLKKISANQV